MKFICIAHAIAAAAQEAVRARADGKETTILLNWSGHGLIDLTGYENFLTGKMMDATLSEGDLGKSLQSLAGLPQPPKM